MNHCVDMDHTKRYAIARHHAWAGSVLLAILLAVRVFIVSTTVIIPDIIFALIGGMLVLYILISLIITYKHRSGLLQQQSNQQYSQDASSKESYLSKEQLKIQKKQAKALVKQQKKQQKQ